MQGSNNKYYKPLIVLGSFLYPHYALPWIIKYMIKSEYIGYFLFSWVMAYSAYLMMPYNDFDLTRHYHDFEVMSKLDFGDIFTVDPRVKHYFFNVYLWLLHQVGLSKQFAPFLITFAKYMFYFATFRKILKAYPSVENQSGLASKWLMIIFLFLLIGTIRFVGDTSGLRNSFAFSIFIYAVFSYYLDGRRLAPLLLFVFSMGIHLSVIPLVFLFYFSTIFRYARIGRVVFVVAVLLIFTGMADKLFFLVMDILKPYLQASGLYFPDYMSSDGKWGAGFWAGQRMAIVILERYLNPSAFYFAALYLLIVKQISFNRIKIFLYLTFSFIVLVSISRTMLSRYAYFFELFFMFILLIEYRSKPLTKFKKIFLVIFIATVLAIKLGGIYRYRIIYVQSWGQSMLIPAPVMMLKDIGPHNYILPNGS
jgi:hypothetical protein